VASLAGSAKDVDAAATVKLPPRSAVPPSAATAGPPASAVRHRRLKPTWSSNGSASSYDNLDEPSTPPRGRRPQPWMRQPRSSHRAHPAAPSMAGSGTDEGLEEPGQRLTPAGAPSIADGSTGGSGVWRRPTLDGHVQIIPPTMIGVFDPTSQLSKFASQTSARRTSPVKVQRQRGSAATAMETVPNRMAARFEAVDYKRTNRVPSDRTLNNIDVRDSSPQTYCQTTFSRPSESTEATDSKSRSPCDEPSKQLNSSKTTEICETVNEETNAAAENNSTSSSSSSSTADDQGDVECTKVDVDGEGDCAEVASPAVVDPEPQPSPTTPACASRSSSAAFDVSEQKSEQETTSGEQSSLTTLM